MLHHDQSASSFSAVTLLLGTVGSLILTRERRLGGKVENSLIASLALSVWEGVGRGEKGEDEKGEEEEYKSPENPSPLPDA